MLNFLILLILMFSLVTALFNGKMDFLCNQLLDSPQKAVELTITVGCSICLWSGVMEVARQSGLLRFLSKFFSPILSLLFPGIKKDSPAAQAVCLNLPPTCPPICWDWEQPQLRRESVRCHSFSVPVSTHPLRATIASCSSCSIPPPCN